MRLAADVVVLALFLGATQQWLRRAGKGLPWALFLAVPLLLTPAWFTGTADLFFARFNSPVLFCWLKLYSVLAAACWLTRLRFTGQTPRPWEQRISLLILPINILEAIFTDIMVGEWNHQLNAVAGLLLVAALPYSSDAIQRTTRGNCHDLDYRGLTRAWITGYTIWNWVFVYLNFPVLAGQHLGVLGAAYLIGMLEPGRWFQARTYSLAIALVLLVTFPAFMLIRTNTEAWSSTDGGFLAAAASLSFMILLLFVTALSRVRALQDARSGWQLSRSQLASDN
jgi:hypothetical protein